MVAQTRTLPATGPITLNTVDAIVVGGPGALNDELDSTYVESNADGFHAAEASVKIQPVEDADEQALGLPVLHIRVSMTGGDDGSNGSLYLFLQNGDPEDYSGDKYIAKFTNGSWFGISYDLPLPLDGTIQDLTLPLVRKPTGVFDADIWACLQDDPYLMINALENRGWQTSPVARIYEAYLTYEVEVEADTSISARSSTARARFGRSA